MDIVRQYAEAITAQLASGNPALAVSLDQSKYWSQHSLLSIRPPDDSFGMTLEFHEEDLRVICSARISLPSLDDPAFFPALADALGRVGVSLPS